ncbi:tetratricopeptide repeat protein [Limibacter armeniacum]|uniref:tetratricopeptide repeat protein n=1 Tax=Limibacter armeniacum TaxID=466084 RepID=UPI002FE6A378
MMNGCVKLCKCLFYVVLLASFVACSSNSGDTGGENVEEIMLPVTTNSEEAMSLFVAGRDLLDNVRKPEARRMFDEAIEKDSSFALAHLFRAWSGTSEEDVFLHLNKAYALKDKVTPEEKMLIEASYMGYHNQLEQSIGTWEKLSEKVPEDKRVLNSLAYAYSDGKEDYEKAIELLKKSIALDPDFPANYNSLGFAYQNMGDVRKAEEAFKKYVELIPNEPNPHDAMGDFYRKNGQFDKAIEEYRKALELNSRFDESQHKIGESMLYSGRYDDAIRELEHAVSIATSEQNKIWHMAEIARVYLHKGDQEQALAKYVEAKSEAQELGLQAYTANLILDMSTIYMYNSEYAKAAEYLATFEEYVGNSSLAESVKENLKARELYNRSLLYAMQREPEKGMEEASLLKEHISNSDNPEELEPYHQAMAYLYYIKDDLGKAKEELEVSEKDSPYTYYLMAKVAEKDGNGPQANQYYQRVIDWNEDDDIYYSMIRPKAMNKNKM